jgi:ParB/RepB/Spo0J family partition protein
MTTTFEPKLDINLIDAHPKNVRHKASADPELIASIKASGLIQPVIVAPHPDAADRYVLIAGHRRLDGSEQAGRKTVPAVVRTDLVTEGQQVEAMLIENGRRTDLTPIEEAEGYEQLTIIGYKPKDIAAAVGHTAKTVTSRLRLLKLNETTREKVHDGAITLEDALALTTFTNDPKTTAALEKAAGTSDFKWQLQRAQNKVKARERTAVKVKQLQDAGAKEYTLPDGAHNVWHVDDGPRPTWSISGDFADAKHHDGCLAYLVDQGGTDVAMLCLEPNKHQVTARKQTPEERAEHETRQREFEEQQAARKAELEQLDIARTLRVTKVLEHIPTGVKIPKELADTFRALLPAFVTMPDGIELTEYWRAMDVAEDDRWIHHNSWVEKQLAHIEQMADWSDYAVLRAVVGVLLSCVEYVTDPLEGGEDPVGNTVVLRYLAHLDAIGHDFTDVDREIQTTARGGIAAVSDQDEEADQ